jgi:hypothetical protein
MPEFINATNITPPRVPLIDQRTGLMSREWYRFFLNLFTLTGSGTNQVSLTDLQLGPPPIQLESISFDPSTPTVNPSDSPLLSQTAEMQKQIDGLELAPTPNIGTVTSVALALPIQFTVSGSPITSYGTLTATWATQTANYVFAGPTSGAATTPTFRALVAADIPTLPYQPTAAPVTYTANFSVAATDVWIINNKSGSSCTATLPAASSYTGRVLRFQNYQAQTLVSASSNVVPIVGGAAGTAILANVAGDTATLVSDGTNWIMTQYTPNNILLLE